MQRIFAGLAALLVAAPFAARADSEFSIVLSGGAARYTKDVAGGTDTGAEYGARLGVMPTPQLGVELGYLGSQNNVKATLNSGNSSATLRTNAGYADLRVNLLPGEVMPYAFGGYGRTWFSGADAAGVSGRGVNTLPFGAGVDVNLGAFKVGGRFQYNYMFEKIDVATGPGGASGGVTQSSNPSFYGVSLDLGASFR